MKKSDIIKQLAQAAVKTFKSPYLENDSKECSRYDDGAYIQYLEDELVEDEKLEFERHLKDCPSCLHRLQQAFKICRKVEESYVLSEIGQKKSLNKTLRYLDSLFKKDISAQQPFSIAAADRGLTGTAYGIAVDPDSGAGILLECSAWVSEQPAEQGTFDLRGIEVESIKKGDKHYSFSSPLELLEDQLEDLFEFNPFVKPFKLLKRNIIVEIIHEEETGYITEARSLALTCIIAILNAIAKKGDGQKSSVFSAGIRQDGKLKKVGRIPQKLDAARGLGVTEFIMSEENLEDCKKYINDPDIAVKAFACLEDVLEYQGLFEPLVEPLVEPLEKKPDYEAATPEAVCAEKIVCRTRPDSVEGWKFVVENARQKGLNENLVIALCELTEDLSQIRREGKPVSTAFIVGEPENTVNILPQSPLKFMRGGNIHTLQKEIIELAAIVDGLQMGFFINTNGGIHSIRKLNIDLKGGFHVNRLLTGTSRKYALISKMTKAMIFFVLAGGNRVNIFNNGSLIGRYANGNWEPADYDKFEQVVSEIAEIKNIQPYVIEKVSRAAVRMSDFNQGAIFVLFDGKINIKDRYSDTLKRLSVNIEVDSIRDIADSELINFAKEDGAVLIDNNGNLSAFMAFLRPKRQESLDYDTGIGVRHYTAQVLSKDIGCMCITISQDGYITVFSDGNRIYKI